MRQRALLVAIAPAVLLLAGCAHNNPQPPAVAGSASSSTTTTTDTTPAAPIIDSPAAFHACGGDHLPVGAQLVGAYDTTVGDVVGWQESHGSGGIWRQHNLNQAAWVCYTTYSDAYDWSQYHPPCAVPAGAAPGSCPPPHPTGSSTIIAADGEVQPAGWDSWLARPPHLNGPPPPAPPQPTPPQ